MAIAEKKIQREEEVAYVTRPQKAQQRLVYST